MAWHTDPRILVATACVLALTACGDSGGREDSGSTMATITASTGSPSDGGSAGPTTGDAVTAGSASASGTTGDGGSATAPVTASASATDPTGEPDPTGEEPCPMGQIECDGNTAKVCDGMGGYSSEMPCAETCGCVDCVSGSHRCLGEVSQVCAPDGAAWVDENTCDALQGLSCDLGSGTCIGACLGLGTSYIGCDYYPVVTRQASSSDANPFAVAVANTTDQAATVTVTRGPNVVAIDMVAPGSVKVIPLPWVAELLKGAVPSVLAVDGAYRLRSTRPVTVYQFNALNASVSNDASVMPPVNAWTGHYLVASWQHFETLGWAGFYSVTASQDNTTVTLKAPKGGTPTRGGGGVDGSGNGVVVLNQGDVLQVLTAPGGELTGSIVSADKPVQVIGGHEATNVPVDIDSADHLEESMLPTEALAKEYIVVPPVQFPDETAEKAIIVRVVASEANTTLTFEPDQAVTKLLANAGDFVEIPSTTAKFVVKADKKILVAQYMASKQANSGFGDPAMLLAVPTAQFRSSYLFYAQPGWQANYVDIIAPTGASVMVDSIPVVDFAPIGATAFSLAHVKLSNSGDGTHSVSGDQKVGISVYGVIEEGGSYWYPGGLDIIPL